MGILAELIVSGLVNLNAGAQLLGPTLQPSHPLAQATRPQAPAAR
jgi:hypothetical protein